MKLTDINYLQLFAVALSLQFFSTQYYVCGYTVQNSNILRYGLSALYVMETVTSVRLVSFPGSLETNSIPQTVVCMTCP